MWHNYQDNYYGDEFVSGKLPEMQIESTFPIPMGYIGFFKLKERKPVIRIKAMSRQR